MKSWKSGISLPISLVIAFPVVRMTRRTTVRVSTIRQILECMFRSVYFIVKNNSMLRGDLFLPLLCLSGEVPVLTDTQEQRPKENIASNNKCSRKRPGEWPTANLHTVTTLHNHQPSSTILCKCNGSLSLHCSFSLLTLVTYENTPSRPKRKRAKGKRHQFYILYAASLIYSDHTICSSCMYI